MIAWFLSNMVWASFAMLLVLAIRQPVARLFGAGPAYALWLLPVLRLLAPPLPDFAPDISPTLPPLTVIVAAAEAAAPLPPAGGPGQWVPILLAIWAGGAALFLGRQCLSYRRFLAELRQTARSLGDYRGLQLVESAAVQGPVALGLLHRRIVVPTDFSTRYSAGERSLALAHEAVHHRRGDLWWNYLGLVMLALNWFNPLAWFAFRAFRADQELACDAAVTARADPAERHDYARALIKSASRPGLIAACPLNHADQLKRRLKMMKTHRSGRARMLAGAAAVTLLAGLSLTAGAPSFAQAGEQKQAAPKQGEPTAERREERVIVIMRDGHGDGDEAGQPTSGGTRERRVHTVVRHHDRTEGGEGHAAPGGATVRSFTLHRGGPGGHAEMAGDCREGNGRIANVEEREGNRQTRFILCGPENMDPARRLRALEQARATIAEQDDIGAESRARVLASLDREIARLRGQ